MNVDGLTKANIKSHLQKYRCLMQKKAQAARQNGGVQSGGMSGVLGGGVGAPAGRLDGGQLNGSPALLGSTLESLGAVSSTSNHSSVASTIQPEGFEALGGAVGDSLRCSGLPEQLLSQGESSLQRNLEVQEMTLKVQMELQEELSRQLQLQKKLQGEMEGLMSAHAEVRDESTATNSKMGSILALKRKLQHELQAHLRMQHQLLSQLNQSTLPAVERLHTGAEADGLPGNGAHSLGGGGGGGMMAPPLGGAPSRGLGGLNGGGAHGFDFAGVKSEAGGEGEGEDDDDDDDDDGEEGEEEEQPTPKRRRAVP